MRAGVNQGLITYHFRSKDELWRAAADRIFSLLRTGFSVRPRDGPGATAASGRARRFAGTCASSPLTRSCSG